MFLGLEFSTERVRIFNSIFLCSYKSVRPHYIIIIIIIIIIITTTTTTETEFSPGGSSAYTSTDKAVRIKYTWTKQYKKRSTLHITRNYTYCQNTHTLQNTQIHALTHYKRS